MALCSIDDVKMTLKYPEGDLSRFSSEATISEMITISEDELNTEYRTKFVQDVSPLMSVASATALTVTPSSAMIEGQYNGKVLRISDGAGAGQYRLITSNTTGVINVEKPFSPIPDNTSKFLITDAGVRDEMKDGFVNNRVLFLPFTPVIDVINLEYDDRVIDEDEYVLYKNTGEIDMGKIRDINLVAGTFRRARPIKVKYIYGETDIKPLIKRLCTIKAAMKVLTADISGTRDEIVRANLPGVYFDKGELYRNIDQALIRLRNEHENIKHLVFRPRVLIA